jgi:hypothetical protein
MATLPDGFWQTERQKLAVIMLPRLEQVAYLAQQKAALKMGISFDPVLSNKVVEAWARDYTDTVLQALQTTTEERVGDILADWLATPGATIGDLTEKLAPMFGRSRASRIAQTEITRAYGQGEAIAYEREGIGRPVILPVEDTHPGCYCWLVVKRAGNQNFIVWQTNRDDRVCKQDLDMPWGETVGGCQALDNVIVSEGEYTGQLFDEIDLVKMVKAAQPDASFDVYLQQHDREFIRSEMLKIEALILNDQPAQTAPDPSKANAAWLRSHDPRRSIYMTGQDESGAEMVAYLVDGQAVRDNVWQDFTAGGNHSRYPWIPPFEYWLDVANSTEYADNLVHETREDRDMRDQGESYEEAHAAGANSAEFAARHGEDPLKLLASMGWRVNQIGGIYDQKENYPKAT